jgi:nitrogen fixation NifU-like protein
MLSNEQGQLYHQALLKHHKKPVGFAVNLLADGQAVGENAACGDEITIEFTIKNGQINELAFHGDSCAICRASASLLCLHLKDLDLLSVRAVNNAMITFITDNKALLAPWSDVFSALSVVQQFPVRKQCAILPWTTFKDALDNFDSCT